MVETLEARVRALQALNGSLAGQLEQARADAAAAAGRHRAQVEALQADVCRLHEALAAVLGALPGGRS